MAEIAERLNLSRQTVGRHLQRARDQGVVKIVIDSPLIRCTELEADLEDRFGLKEAYVITPLSNTEEAVKDGLGVAGAEFIERSVVPRDVIGVAWSTTVLACAENLNSVNCEDVTVVQLNGSLDRAAFSTRAEYIIEKIARAFNADQVTLPIPLMVDRPEIIDSLMSDSRLASNLEQARKATFAIFGVGDISPQSSLYKTGYMDNDLLSSLRSAGAVGEICGRYYNDNGDSCMPGLDNRIMAIELSELRHKRISVAVAGMPHKTAAILGMLRGHFCNVLITDEETAKVILSAT